MSDDRTLAVYNRQTDEYAAMMDREAASDPMIGRFIAACPAGARVLDLGCGTGHYAKRMAEAGLRPGDCWFGKASGMAGHPEGWIVLAAHG